MTAPIPGFQAATPLKQDSYWVLPISGTAQSVSIAQALEAAVAYGYSGGVDVYASNGTPIWRLRITDSNGVDQFAYQGQWLVIQGNVLTFYTNEEFAAKLSLNAPAPTP